MLLYYCILRGFMYWLIMGEGQIGGWVCTRVDRGMYACGPRCDIFHQCGRLFCVLQLQHANLLE